MAFVSSFVYCDRIQETVTPNGPVSQIVNPLQALRPVSFPSNYSFAIACGICDFDGKKTNTINIKCLDPMGNDILKCGEIKIDPIAKVANGTNPTTLNINLDFRNVILRMSGIYTSVVTFNGQSIGEYKIQVLKAE